jgi:hypothetical protein
MTLETIIRRASAMDRALGKRTAYVRVLELVTDTAIRADGSHRPSLLPIIDAVRAMDDEARAEYEAAKAVSDA